MELRRVEPRTRGKREAEDRQTVAAAAASPQVETVRDGGSGGADGGYWKIRPNYERTDGNFSSFCAMRDDSYGRREGRKGLWLPEFWRQIDRWSEYPREGRTKSFETLQLWYRSISFNLTFGMRVRGTSSLLGQPSLSDCLPHTDAVPSLILSSHLPVHRCFRGISHSVSPRQRRWASDAQGGHVLLGALKTCHLFIPIISGTVSASGWTKVLERCETAQ